MVELKDSRSTIANLNIFSNYAILQKKEPPMDYGLVNAFLASEDLSESEELMKQNVVGLNDMLKRLQEERSASAETLQKKEQELLKVSGALENQLSVVEFLARKKGLTPLVQEEPVQPSQEAEEQKTE